MKALLVVVLLVFGCGGEEDDRSGLDPALPLGTLVMEEVDTLCIWGASLSRAVDCDGEEVESTTDESDCVDLVEELLETCPATVADFETCFEDLAAQSDDEVCELETAASCNFIGDPDCLDL